jgi:small conductance mechanosensitive channel
MKTPNLDLSHITVSNFLLFLFALVATFVVANSVSVLVYNMLDSKLKRPVVKLIQKLVLYIILVGGIYFSLIKIINFNLPAVLTALGVFGAFCFVPTVPILQNAISGLVVALMRPVKEGDFIDMGGEVCEVTDMLLLKTKLRTKDGRIILMPNLTLVTGNITKFVKGKLLQITVNIDYKNEKPMEDVVNILEEICAESPDILPCEMKHKENLLDKYFEEKEKVEELNPQILVSKATKDKISLILHFWTWRSALEKEKVLDDFYRSLKNKAEKNNLELL